MLVDRAQAAGVQVLAITDHDTLAGYRAAARHYNHKPGGMVLLPGIEMSTQWSGVPIHVLGLGVAPAHPVLVEAVAELTVARRARNVRIAEKLTARGFGDVLAAATALAGTGQLGRPHFARVLVAGGHVRDENEAFDRYLGNGKQCYAAADWPELATVVAWIRAAGGVAVVAHPLKYKLTASKLKRLLADFRAAGGEGLEVVSGRQEPADVLQLLRLLDTFELVASGGSDFHRDAPYAAGLGVTLPLRRGQLPVWSRMPALGEHLADSLRSSA